MAPTPAATECQLIQPNAKSTTAQTVKKAMGFIPRSIILCLVPAIKFAKRTAW